MVGADSNTTDNFDIGYDAPMYDLTEDDCYWNLENSEFVIQGISDFNTDRIIPISVNIANTGLSTIKIDSLENVSEDTEIYLHDSLTETYHDLRENDFSIALPIGEYKDRFSLRFSKQTLGVIASQDEKPIVYFTNNNNTLYIKNNNSGKIVKSVQLYNIVGQHIVTYPLNESNQENIQIPIRNLPTSTYIVKVITDGGNYSEKIILNNR